MNGNEIMVVDPFGGELDNFGGYGGYGGATNAQNATVSRQFSENYGNPKNNKYTLTDVPGQTIRLTTVDGQVLYEGTGPEAVNKAADIVDALNQAYGPGATWKLQTKPEGAQDFTTVSQDTVAKQKKTALNSFLDFALPALGGILVPGLGLLGGVAGAAAGAGGASLLNSALQNQSLDDAIKTALLNAAGAGAGNYLGGQLSGALQGAGGAGTGLAQAEGALINAGSNFANSGALDALAQSFGQTIGGAAGTVSPVIINAANQGLIGSLLGSGLGSGLGAATGAVGGGVPNVVDTVTVTPSQPDVTVPTTGVGGTPTTVDPVVVTPSTQDPNVVEPVVVTPPTTGTPTTQPTTNDNTVSPVTVTPPPGTILQDLGAGAGVIIAGAIPGSILWQPSTTVSPVTVTPPTNNGGTVTPGVPNVVDPITVTPPSKPTTTTDTPLTPYVPVTPPVTQMPYVDPNTITPPSSKPNVTDLLPVIAGLLGGAAGGSKNKTYTSATWDKGTRPGEVGSLANIFRGTLPVTNLNNAPRDMADRDWTKYGFDSEASFFNNVPERNFAKGGYAVTGPGTGRSDSIKAKLSDGEYVVDAETVALLGDGSSKAGARKLDELRVKVRKAKGKDLAKGKFSVNAASPEHYMRGGRT